MPRKRHRAYKKANTILSDVNTSVMEEDVDQIRRDTFLLDFDLQVQRTVATMQSEIKQMSYIGRIMDSYILGMPKDVRKMSVQDFLANGGTAETLTMPELGDLAETKLTKRLPLTEKTNIQETPQMPQTGRTKRKAASKAATAISASTRTTRSKARLQTKGSQPEIAALMTPICSQRNIPVPVSTSRKPKQGEVLYSHNQSPVEPATPSLRPGLDYLKQVVDCNSPQFITEIQKLIDRKMQTVVKEAAM